MHARSRCLSLLFALTGCVGSHAADGQASAVNLDAKASDAGVDHEQRRIYIPCARAEDCGDDAQCSSPGADIAPACYPTTGLQIDETDVAQDACPMLDARFTQKRFYNLHCVIECDADFSAQDADASARRCPAQIPRCIDNPFRTVSPYEAGSFCVP